jgi:putative endonuclease
MANSNTLEIGDWGESQAVDFLLGNGYVILERNWRWKKFEVDIIAQIGNTLVFVEVKSRKNSDYGHPESFVDFYKATRVKKASVEYQLEKKYEGFIRFDIISITGNKTHFEIYHLPDAF